MSLLATTKIMTHAKLLLTRTLPRRTLATAAPPAEPLVQTALYNLHKELGGDMVPFAGYELPVLYKGSDNGGVMKEHLWCRADHSASLFDVSHMGQVRCLCCLVFMLLSALLVVFLSR